VPRDIEVMEKNLGWSDAFYDHLDVLPTILDLAGAPDAESYGIGESIVPIIRDPAAAAGDRVVPPQSRHGAEFMSAEAAPSLRETPPWSNRSRRF
jgi:hypothetical protein